MLIYSLDVSIPVEYFGEKKRWWRRWISDVHFSPSLPVNEIILIREYSSVNVSLPSKNRLQS